VNHPGPLVWVGFALLPTLMLVSCTSAATRVQPTANAPRSASVAPVPNESEPAAPASSEASCPDDVPALTTQSQLTVNQQVYLLRSLMNIRTDGLDTGNAACLAIADSPALAQADERADAQYSAANGVYPTHFNPDPANPTDQSGPYGIDDPSQKNGQYMFGVDMPAPGGTATHNVSMGWLQGRWVLTSYQ